MKHGDWPAPMSGGQRHETVHAWVERCASLWRVNAGLASHNVRSAPGCRVRFHPSWDPSTEVTHDNSTGRRPSLLIWQTMMSVAFPLGTASMHDLPSPRS